VLLRFLGIAAQQKQNAVQKAYFAAVQGICTYPFLFSAGIMALIILSSKSFGAIVCERKGHYT
jgi:hypothetical protein